MKKRKMEMQLAVQATEENREQVEACLMRLQEMFLEFETTENVFEIRDNMARINGFCDAMVNMGVLDADEVNEKVQKAVMEAATTRVAELEGVTPESLLEEGTANGH